MGVNENLPVPVAVAVPVKPTLVWSPHALMPSEERALYYDVIFPHESVEEYLSRVGLLQKMGRQPYVLTINGSRVPQALWAKCYPHQGALLKLYAVAQGGGEGSKNPIAIILSIGLMAFAPWAAVNIFGMTAGTFGAFAVAAGINVLGGLAINALFPPPRPNLRERQGQDTSPTYSLAGGSNQVRRFAPMPYVVGKHKIFPDFGNTPHTEFEGEEQFAFYMYEFGYSDVILSDFKIGDDVLDNFAGVTLEESSYNGKIQLFPGNVDSIAGGALTFAAGFITRTTSEDTHFAGVDIIGSLFKVDDEGNMVPHSIVHEVQYREVGTVPWLNFSLQSDVIPQIVNPFAGTIFEGAFRQAIQEFNQTNNSPLPDGQFRIIHSTRKPVRRTLFLQFPKKSQYEIRVRRITADDTDPKFVSELFWNALRSYQPDDGNYQGRKRVGLKIRASGQLSGVLEEFSAIAEGRAQLWDPIITITEGYESSSWVAGQIPTGYAANQSQAGESLWETKQGPFLNNEVVNVCRNLDTFAGEPGNDGGWNLNTDLPVDITKGYIFFVYAKKMTVNGKFFWGPGPSFSPPHRVSELVGAGGAAAENPYFISNLTNFPNTEDWFLAVGYVHPEGYAGAELGISGIYDLYGNKLIDGLEYRWTTGTTAVQHRCYHYYNEVDVPSLEVQHMTRPVILQADSGVYQNAIDDFLTRKNPSSTGWSAVPTQNPAWWFLDCARGRFIGAQRVWGAGFADAKIDIEGIKTWATWCVDQGLTVNAVFDTQRSVFEVLSTIALNGRATISWATGKLGVIWDEADLPVTGHYGMHNIIPGSFEVDYLTEDLADVIVGEYIDANNDYKQDFVRVIVPGATEQIKEHRVQLFGRTSQTLAAEDTNLYAAQNAYRNRRYKWRSEWEAMANARGDVVELTHDMASLDFSGRFIEGGTVSILKLSKKVSLFPGGAFILIRSPSGQVTLHTVEANTGETDELQLVTPLSANEPHPWNDPGSVPYDWTWQYGPSSTPGKKVKIEQFKPVSERIVEIHAVDEIPEFYIAKDNPYSFVPPFVPFNTVQISDLVLDEDPVRAGSGYMIKIVATWQSSGDYEYSNIKVGINGSTPELKGQEIRGNAFEFLVNDFSVVEVEVIAYGKLGRFGKTSKISATIDIQFASAADPSDVTNFVATIISTGIRLTWNQIPDVDLKEYSIWLGAAYESGVEVFRGLLHEYIDLPKLPNPYNYFIKAIDVAGRESLNATQVTATVNVIGAPSVSYVVNEVDIVLSWTTPTMQFAVDTFEVRYGASFAGGTSIAKTKSNTLKVPITWGGDRTFWVAVTDIAGQTGGSGSVTASIAAAPAPTTNPATIAGEHCILSWNAPVAALPIREYEIRHGASFGAGTFVTRIKGTTHTLKVEWSGTRTFWVAAVDSSGTIGASASINVSVTVPSAVSITAQVIDNNVLFQWTDGQQTLPIKHYEIRKGDTFADATVIGTVLARFTVIFESAQGTYRYWIVGVDSADNYGQETSLVSTVNQPPDYVLFDTTTSQMDSTSRSNWLPQGGTHYALDFNGSTQYGQVTSVPDLDSGITGLTFEAWIIPDSVNQQGGIVEKTVGGNVNTCALLFMDSSSFLRMRVDIGGTDITASVDISAKPVGAPMHVVGRWDSTNGVQLAIDGVNVATTAAAGSLSQGAGALYVGRLGTGANYPYNGKLGPMRIYKRRITDTEVAEHYHGIFKDETSLVIRWDHDEGEGVSSRDDSDNAYNLDLVSAPAWVSTVLDGRFDPTLGPLHVYFPHEDMESISEYATRTGDATPNDVISGNGGDFGPLVPAPSTAQYVEVFDLGATLDATKINIDITHQAVLGTVTITPKISVKLNAGDSWTDFAGVFSVFTTNFRYVKITLDITSAGGAHVRKATLLNMRLDVKLINDGGTVTCNSGDSGGTQVNFNIDFVDVHSITVTPKGTTSVTAVYDFVDAPNPTGFKVLLFNSTTGARVSGDAGWSAKGV